MQSSSPSIPKPAIIIADNKWCESASQGRIRIYNFKNPRKKKIRALKPGSICIVFTKQTQTDTYIACGEFQVRIIKEITYKEYNLLMDLGCIADERHQEPVRNKRWWVISFDKFREYKNKIPLNEMNDITTANGKPLSQRKIIGLIYIDKEALNEIRRRAEGRIEK